ncbi:MAG: DUF58 domain-containing protein [Thermoplasmata archaeon]
MAEGVVETYGGMGVIHRSRTSAALVTLAMTALVFSIFYGSWTLLASSIVLISVVIISFKDIPPDNIDVEVRIGREEIHLHEGDDFQFKIHINNQGKSLEFLEVFHELPPELEVIEGSNHNLLSLDASEEKTVTYRVSVPLRGDYPVSKLRLRARDYFGIFRTERVVHKPFSIHVLPAEEKMKQGKIRPCYPKNRLGNISSKAVGVGTEFFSLREYRAGDRMKDINWKATAKNLEPITNDFEGEMSGDVILIVDGFKGSNIGSIRDNTFSASVRAAATLSSNILADRNRVGLIVLGERLSWVYPGYGRGQYYKIIAQLSSLTSGGLWQLHEVQGILQRFFPSRCLLIIISPLTNPKVTEAIYDMTRRKYNILIISPSPLAIERRIGDSAEELAEKMYTLNRNNTINQLWRYCTVLDWDPHEPLELAVEEVGRYRR